MKKLITFSFALLLGGLVYAANENFKVPLDVGNIPDPGLRSAGVNKVQLVTSTNAVLATDADGDTIKKGFIYYVVAPSSIAVTGSKFLVVRDTDTANLTSALALPYIWFADNTAGGATGYPVLQFDPPIPFYNGLSLNLGAAGTTPATGEGFAVGIRKALSQ